MYPNHIQKDSSFNIALFWLYMGSTLMDPPKLENFPASIPHSQCLNRTAVRRPLINQLLARRGLRPLGQIHIILGNVMTF